VIVQALSIVTSTVSVTVVPVAAKTLVIGKDERAPTAIKAADTPTVGNVASEAIVPRVASLVLLFSLLLMKEMPFLYCLLLFYYSIVLLFYYSIILLFYCFIVLLSFIIVCITFMLLIVPPPVGSQGLKNLGFMG
jgi:hypothetical protein